MPHVCDEDEDEDAEMMIKSYIQIHVIVKMHVVLASKPPNNAAD